MVRYTKAGMLEGEQNLALPPITENLVEVRPVAAQLIGCWQPMWRATRHPARVMAMLLTTAVACSAGAGSAAFQPCRPPPPPLTSQCELNDDDDYWYRSLQREQKQCFSQIVARLRIDMDMLGGGCRQLDTPCCPPGWPGRTSVPLAVRPWPLSSARHAPPPAFCVLQTQHPAVE